jgi:hypothetical protein
MALVNRRAFKIGDVPAAERHHALENARAAMGRLL